MALRVFAFYNGLTEQARGYRYLQEYGSLLDDMALFEISIQANGELQGTPSRRLIAEAHALGIKVFLVVSNLTAEGQFSTPLISRLIREPVFADRVWRNIYNLLVTYKFDGVNFDLEKGSPEDRTLFSRFINTWTARFKGVNYLVSIDVPAKTSDERTDVWKGVFDYRALGQSVDQVILMTYEEHWPGSSPGSVASLPWVTRVLNYALANISASKLYLGLPLYGYDWERPGKAQVIGYKRAHELARRYGAPLQWDSEQHSTFFRYETRGQRHTVYFEDLRSLKEKLDLAKRKGIGGVALWEMNLSYPEFWELLSANI
ncbi:glycosyl hydrolase family 18 protein [Paradesulfitobacterium ferrireducens]|uniref:glycosyl hydrolase family 18 protein n=1 Tax=Paradesulfitobacterium ferrireducens TaxID=2816476 RepID=UPI001A901A65|nr:glycosyl hydrolase family 18 protein [Paradesulfitobacterium ferrireducens]